MNLNAYLFGASITRAQIRPTRQPSGGTVEMMQIWGDTPAFIVCANNPEDAQKKFEAILLAQPEGEHPLQTRINRMVAAQLVDQLLTETEPAPLDWPQIAEQAVADVQATDMDDLGQGNWLDPAEVRGACPNLEALRRDLPEETSTGLNWSADRQYYFVISVLSPSPPVTEPAEEPEPSPTVDEFSPDATADDADLTSLARPASDIPVIADLEAAALVRARNAAVAVWLWCQYAAGTRLAGKPMRFDPWCGVAGIEPGENQPEEQPAE